MSDEATRPTSPDPDSVVRCPVCLSTRTQIEEGSENGEGLPAMATLAEEEDGDGRGLVARCLDCGMRIVHLPEPENGGPFSNMTPERTLGMLRVLQQIAREDRRNGLEPEDDVERGLHMFAEMHDLLHRPFTRGCWRTAGGPARHLRYWWTYQYWPPLWLALRRWERRVVRTAADGPERGSAGSGLEAEGR